MGKYAIQISCWLAIITHSFYMVYDCSYGTCENGTCPYWLSIIQYIGFYGSFFMITNILRKILYDKHDKRILNILNKYCLGLLFVNCILLNESWPTYISFCNSILFGWLYTSVTAIVALIYCYRK